MSIPEKLKKARLLLGLNQSQAASESGVKQPHLSDMENADKTLIPVRYILFLSKSGIDLNSVFDEGLEVSLRNSSASRPTSEPTPEELDPRIQDLIERAVSRALERRSPAALEKTSSNGAKQVS